MTVKLTPVDSPSRRQGGWTRVVVVVLLAVGVGGLVLNALLAPWAEQRLEAARVEFAAAVGEPRTEAPEPTVVSVPRGLFDLEPDALTHGSEEAGENDRARASRLAGRPYGDLAPADRLAVRDLLERSRYLLPGGAEGVESFVVERASLAESDWARRLLVGGRLLALAAGHGFATSEPASAAAADAREATRLLGELTAALRRADTTLHAMMAGLFEIWYQAASAEAVAAGHRDPALLAELEAGLPRETYPPGTAMVREMAWPAARAYATTPATWSERLFPWRRSLEESYYYEGLTDYHEASARPYREAQEARARLDDPPWWTPAGTVLPLFMPNLNVAIDRTRAIAASRRLARLALDLAANGAPHPLPADLEPDPFAGELPTLVRRPDGSAVLTLPGADVLWNELMGSNDIPGPPFTWHLPAADRHAGPAGSG